MQSLSRSEFFKKEILKGVLSYHGKKLENPMGERCKDGYFGATLKGESSER
jgi:hypothetical protein